MGKKVINWINLEDKQPDLYQNIIGLTTVGKIKGFYLKNNTFQTRTGLFTFTKWVIDETK